MRDIFTFIDEERERFEKELIDYLSIPSISAQEPSREDVGRCARFTADKMAEAGLEKVEVIETEGHPIAYGEWLKAAGKPTVLVYGHYDVQPPEPLDEWTTPPFEPAVRDGRVYARGSADDKGQIYAHIKAVEAFMRTRGSLPVNVKFVIEGEEEVGSGSLEKYVPAHKEKLSSDVCVVSDTPMFGKGMPSICYGLRGITYLEVELRGSSTDLHSGTHGGVVANPAVVLCRMLGSIKDEKGRITIPGFYDDVRDLEPDEKENFRSLPLDEEAYRKTIGAPRLFHEEGYSIAESKWTRPTFDICGIYGGYTGEGAKTVIPAKATAKISCRLVPHQDPGKITELVVEHLKKIAPDTVEVTIKKMEGSTAFLQERDNPYFQAAKRAVEKGFEAKPFEIIEGGSIPIVKLFHDLLGIPVVIVGFGLPDANTHAPDERFDLDNYRAGIRTSACLMEEMGAEPR